MAVLHMFQVRIRYKNVLFLLSAVTMLDLSMKCRPWWRSFDYTFD